MWPAVSSAQAHWPLLRVWLVLVTCTFFEHPSKQISMAIQRLRNYLRQWTLNPDCAGWNPSYSHKLNDLGKDISWLPSSWDDTNIHSTYLPPPTPGSYESVHVGGALGVANEILWRTWVCPHAWVYLSKDPGITDSFLCIGHMVTLWVQSPTQWWSPVDGNFTHWVILGVIQAMMPSWELERFPS